ncbi:secreted cellulose-binding protein [Legionella wadsworthii]|uniref:Secreted cellulose-binding protein n=1 Tax=Legionella wadsworthii TaxID=28088 RepID=A0A378LV84_9GAMM|nr:lytic polysaccharide monooxygenase [Legionella wadsworthii]STY31311.1 secreted cellulose-binding protein [Legionella wadsworthii]
MHVSKILFYSALIFSSCIFAHGSMETPISRVYQCYKENPENPKSEACKAAVAIGGKQPIYNWNEVNQPAANDRHQDVIADGTLCAGGRDFYKGLNLARQDWPTSLVTPDADGLFNFIFYPTAPHKAKYFRLYFTRANYDFSQPLKWSDLEAPFCTITSVNLVNNRYHLPCKIPTDVSGKRILFMIWQRDDSPEAFYSCSDVFVKSTTTEPAVWNELQPFYNTADIAAGTTVRLRLFKHDGSEIESHSISVTDQNNTRDKWPFSLAEKVNSDSSLLKIGQLQPDTGDIVLTPGETANKIFIKDKDVSQYHLAIDFIEPQSQFDFVYPDGIGQYKANTIVLGRNDHQRYQCKPWPYSGWCNQAPAYYEPGIGLSWKDAWVLLN